jgi:hypothetical protein
MMRTSSSIIMIIFPLLALLGSMALAAQDRYTLKLGKLPFSDFRGYENWKDVAVSRTETLLKAIAANDVMMNAYRQGLPADDKLFPDGSKIVKIEWTPKKNTLSPYFVMVPDTLKAVAVIEKDTKRFPDTHGWAYGNFKYDAASDTFTPEGTTPNADTPATQRLRQKITFSRHIRRVKWGTAEVTRSRAKHLSASFGGSLNDSKRRRRS